MCEKFTSSSEKPNRAGTMPSSKSTARPQTGQQSGGGSSRGCTDKSSFSKAKKA